MSMAGESFRSSFRLCLQFDSSKLSVSDNKLLSLKWAKIRVTISAIDIMADKHHVASHISAFKLYP